MAQDIELSVTITYRGPKAKIATADEAAAIIRQGTSSSTCPSRPALIDVDAYAYRHTPSASSSVTASPQKSSYERTKEGLQNELAEVRRREREILQQLKAMGVNVNTNVASVGEEQLQNDAGMYNSVSLKLPSGMLTLYVARVRGLERELEEERARRREAEAFVADVRRELRAPFVVPALLDAFKDISRLTNETL
ncbi:hypothetical protein MKEN_00511000 [Mycena kentingensis (nom. inval.)]|nr:hypothetical protein MKEN_00511000 [Mycena kentingensis (nom. inval.)]